MEVDIGIRTLSIPRVNVVSEDELRLFEFLIMSRTFETTCGIGEFRSDLSIGFIRETWYAIDIGTTFSELC